MGTENRVPCFPGRSSDEHARQTLPHHGLFLALTGKLYSKEVSLIGPIESN